MKAIILTLFVTCTPTKTEMPAAEAANEVKYMNGCTSTSTKVFVTVSSAFSLKASIVAFLALLILSDISFKI